MGLLYQYFGFAVAIICDSKPKTLWSKSQHLPENVLQLCNSRSEKAGQHSKAWLKQVKVKLKALSEMPNKKHDYETVQKKICAIPAMSLSSKATQEIRLLGAGGSVEQQTKDTSSQKLRDGRFGAIKK